VGRQEQWKCSDLTLSLQQALKILQKALFHATSTDLKSTDLDGQISQLYKAICFDKMDGQHVNPSLAQNI